MLRILLKRSGASLQSCYRGDDARLLLNRLGKQSQAQLWEGFQDHRPGYYPANPPGYSTHELHSDGAAYPSVPRGGRLAWWQCGIDIDDAHVPAFIAEAKKLGYDVWRPYPTGSEYHHVNFRKAPRAPRVKSLLHR